MLSDVSVTEARPWLVRVWKRGYVQGFFSLVLSPFIGIHGFTIYSCVVALPASLYVLMNSRTYIGLYARIHVCFHVYLCVSVAGCLCSRLVFSPLCQFTSTTCSYCIVVPVSVSRWLRSYSVVSSSTECSPGTWSSFSDSSAFFFRWVGLSCSSMSCCIFQLFYVLS